MTVPWRYLVSTTAVAVSFGLGMWSRTSTVKSATVPAAAAAETSTLRPPTQVGGSLVAPSPTRSPTTPANSATMDANADDDVMTLVELGRDMQQLYEAQTRDETWALPMEQFLSGQAKRFFSAILPDAQDLQIECRTSMCKLEFVMPSDPDGIAFGRQQVLPVGSTFHPWREELADGRVRIGLYSAFGPDQRAVAAMEKQFRERFGDLSPQQVLHYLEEEEAEMRKDRQH